MSLEKFVNSYIFRSFLFLKLLIFLFKFSAKRASPADRNGVLERISQTQQGDRAGGEQWIGCEKLSFLRKFSKLETLIKIVKKRNDTEFWVQLHKSDGEIPTPFIPNFKPFSNSALNFSRCRKWKSCLPEIIWFCSGMWVPLCSVGRFSEPTEGSLACDHSPLGGRQSRGYSGHNFSSFSSKFPFSIICLSKTCL